MTATGRWRLQLLAAAYLAATLAAGPAAAQQHEADRAAVFVASLAGEWSVVSEAVLGPGQESVRTESAESARLLGNHWLIAESTGTNALGRSHASLLTLGYDGARRLFVGTWVDSMQRHMWFYTGSLDSQGTTLTLETEGPVMGDPSRTARYRMVIRLADADLKVTRSLILGPDGSWFEFGRAEFRRSD